MNQTVAPPLETERQARELPAVRAVYAAFEADPGPGKMAPHNMRMLLDAVAAAGVYVGAYDVRIIEWLAGWEPATCAVVAGLITRAAAAGRDALPPGHALALGQAPRDAIRYCEYRGGEACADCDATIDGLCPLHADFIEQVSFNRAVARELGIEVDR